MKTTKPQARAEIAGTTATYRSPGGDTADTLTGTSGEDIRAQVLRRTVWEARRVGSPVEVVATGDYGNHHILVSPDGLITPVTESADFIDTGDVTIDSNTEPITERSTDPAQTPSRTQPPLGASGSEREPVRVSFITDEPLQAADGIPGVLARVGVRVKPTAAQAQHRENVRVTSSHWGGCRAIAVVNGKGGVGKTMTTAMLAAVFARHGGGGVLAWDNNDTRGTLGWRTESSQHQATIQDALTAAPALLAPGAGAGDIASYVHHQSADRYDVLRSNPQLLATSQRIGQAEFDQLMQVAARYYRLVIFDSGNDESAERWLRMIDSAHQLVVPTLAAPESAESAALLLEALTDRDEHSAHLAKEAVVIVTQSERGSTGEVRRIVDAFAPLVRAVVVIPFDTALKSGPLRFDALRAATSRAWVASGAAIAAGLQ